MVDPRISSINESLKEIRNIITVVSGKGGVGKSLVASTLALTLAKKNYKVGLFDLDFTSPSTHIILNIQGLQPKEEKGIVPPKVHDVSYMSIIFYSGQYSLPLRAADASNALIELLSITRWEQQDVLILDMPPGISDATLDIIRFVKRIQFFIVTTPSQLAYATVEKLLDLLSELRMPIIGILENMKRTSLPSIEAQVEQKAIRFLGDLPFDEKIEEAIGNTEVLLDTAFARKLEEIVSKTPLF
ncbi:MAG: ATP-binding protein involved in chromosome partitioning [Thermoproteota archaeon]|nr:ATP-binding protein involved in chromosome partitioning [Thermoproteota archaeon]